MRCSGQGSPQAVSQARLLRPGDATPSEEASLPLSSLSLETSVDFWEEIAAQERVKTADCGKTFWHRTHTGNKEVKGCGAKVVCADRCHSHWCRECRRAWFDETQKSILEVAESWAWPVHIILTIPNVPFAHLLVAMMLLSKAFRRLRQRKLWRVVKRGFYTWGLTIGEDGKTWHVHLHILADCQWLDAKKLTETWTAILRKLGADVGERAHTHIERAKARKGGLKGLVAEVIKGTKGDIAQLVKRFDQEDGDRLFGEVIEAFKGRPWVRPFGDLRWKREKPKQYCPQCGKEYDWREWTREGPFSEVKPGWGDRFFGFARDPTLAVINGGHPARVRDRLQKEIEEAEGQRDAQAVAMMDRPW